MKTLADEILGALPALMLRHPLGPTVPEVAHALSAGLPQVSDAAKRLHAEGRAWRARYEGSKRRHLLPRDHRFSDRRTIVCAYCGLVFEGPRKGKRACCTRACSIAWSWTKPGVAERRRAAMQAERQTDAAKERLRQHNARRWSDPEERKKLSEQNRREWSDPAKKARRSASIQAINGSAKKRAETSAIRKALWADPEYREKASAAIKIGKNTAEYRAKHAELMRARWRDPVMRAKYTAANIARNEARAAAMRGRKQSPD